MDLVGTVMGFVTIPMAALSIASFFSGLALLACGAWQPVLFGSLAFALCFGFAIVLEQFVIQIDTAAVRALGAGRRRRARAIAVFSGGAPMLMLLGWELACFRVIFLPTTALRWHMWLWSYGVATGPWTLFAQHVSRFRRTLCGIRAYAGHVAYWLLSGFTLLGAGDRVSVSLMVVPATLPFVVGMLLAVADRDALTNVRV